MQLVVPRATLIGLGHVQLGASPYMLPLSVVGSTCLVTERRDPEKQCRHRNKLSCRRKRTRAGRGRVSIGGFQLLPCLPASTVCLPTYCWLDRRSQTAPRSPACLHKSPMPQVDRRDEPGPEQAPDPPRATHRIEVDRCRRQTRGVAGCLSRWVGGFGGSWSVVWFGWTWPPISSV